MSRVWVLPLLLAAVQLLALAGVAADAEGLVAGPVVALATAALCWRRRWPTAVAGGLLAGGVAVQPFAFSDRLWVLVVFDLVAYYNVAVHRGLRGTVATGGVLAAVQAGAAVADGDADGEPVTVVLFVAVLYALAGFLGRRRRAWLAERAAAAHTLVEAQARRREAAEAERRRLARELHDVTAHHLTSIVVTASAAQRLAGRRPELVDEALGFAARTGRDTLAALHRLVAVMESSPPDERPGEPLQDLAAAFRRLGQRVSVAEPAEPLPAAVAEAVHGIVREALTNTVRYAPGSSVSVRLDRDEARARLIVEDDGAAAPPSATGLGSGRGTAGMRERAAAVGGTLTAGPRRPAGWQVLADLPLSSPPLPDRGGRLRRRLARHWLDALVVLVGAGVPVGVVLGIGGWRSPPGAFALFVLWAVAHAAPLVVRRRRPWEALAAMLTLQWVWLGAVLALGLPEDPYALAGAGAVAELVAVYAVATYAHPVRITWLAALAATASQSVYSAIAVIGAVPAEPGDTRADAMAAAAFIGALVAVVMALWTLVPIAAAWAFGHALGRPREATRARERDAVAAAVAAATATARAERARIGAGLRAAVLHRTGEVTAAADVGDLDGVLARARAALAAMRELLDGLRDDARAGGAPPAAAGIAELCERHRVAGRPVTLETSGAARPLPGDVEVSAYRVVELALAAGDRGPAHARLRYEPAQLCVSVTGVPAATGGTTAAALRARVTALGGTVEADPSGTVAVRLPVPAPAPAAPTGA